MDKHSRWIKESLKDLTRIRDNYTDRSDMFRMDRNERTWDFSDEIIDSIKNKIDSNTLTNYPDVDNVYLKLSQHLGVVTNQIYLHSGSDLVIRSIFETYISPGDRVMLQKPSYAMYGVYSKMYQADLYEYSYSAELSFDTDGYCDEVKNKRPKLVVVENPNGYIGNSFSHSLVERIVTTAKDVGSLVLVDEAYIDYIPKETALDLIEQFDNLIVVRTFSKAWGLAGLRAGYAVSNSLLISEIFKVMPMHELTSTTVIALETLLEHSEDIASYIEEVKKVRMYFCKELERMGIRYVNSDTHFVTVCLGDVLDTDEFRKKAHDNRFFVRRPFGMDILSNWIRIGLIPMEDMKKFVVFLDNELSKADVI